MRLVKGSQRPVLKYFAGAYLVQFAILGVCMFLHQSSVPLGRMLDRSELVSGAMSKPTLGRLVYALAAALLFFIFTALASGQAKRGKNYAPFILGTFAGTFLWQAIGEDLWHFSVDGVHFVRLESVSVLPLIVLFFLTLVRCAKHNSADWGMWCMVLSFSVNWLGHYVLEGIYPLFASLCTEAQWYKGTGILLGSALLLTGLILGIRKAKTPKQWMLSAVLCYYATAVLAFGFIES